ncbi:MAG: tetratricopeptide repeat protein [Desulfovibrionaceae bacterium]
MSDKLSDAKKQLVSVKGLVKSDKLTQAIKTLARSAKAYIDAKPKLLRGEQTEFENHLHKAVYAFNFNQRFREIAPDGLSYTSGQEAALIRVLVGLIQEVSEHKTKKKEADEAKINEKKHAYLDKGKKLLNEGSTKKAFISFRMGAKEFKDDAEYIAEMGRLLMQAGDYDNATELFVMAVDAKDDDVGILNLAGSAFRKIRKHQAAAKYFSMALEISPRDEVLLYNAARNHIDWRKWDDAYDALRAALEINPDFDVAKKTLKLVESKMFGSVDGK